ncbi:MAG: efflux RND transporter periplasmic adaptor subunit [Methylicorpusculum sp.]|jgi:cobalt-zinc-cadmium efflux system membrane fusion protein|uniref:efflux RND transporter periplasmic adaptor subunit n=1 Tax=Methylicorpusculum TaxID=2713642 RepID=UPI001357F329|nr:MULTISPECIES: efflux RND transporter periplasmic adaptor subunit [Methylicorpusculum]MCD2452086.1 efflux RND transporter periplasmic adaptor subunit [Methylicorpusculum oleiharenae]MDP2203458.1 efflux RND transporter periplasmic adaptor subunit [Methylicorpusculum sp.]
MKTKQSLIISGLIAVGIVLAVLILRLEPPTHTEEESESHEAKTDDNGGPHGGKLFVKGDFELEILLAEDEGEPRFRIYLFNQDKPLSPNAAQVSAIVTRPDGEKQNIDFVSEKDFLQSAQPIEEPHVFEATVIAQHDSQSLQFSWVKEEGKINLTDQQVKEAGVKTQTAGGARIKNVVTLPGEIRFNEDKTSHVVPRLAGVVEVISANLGDPVKKGQVLVVIASTGLAEQRSELLSAQKRLELARATFAREKHLWGAKISAEQDYLQARQVMNEAEIDVHNAQQKLMALGASPNVSVNSGSLNRYEIRAPFDGMIVEKHIALGEAVKEDASIFTISDLSSVWAEIIVSAKDLNVIRVGGKVMIKATALDSTASGTVSYVGALMGEQTRTATARVTLANPQMAWRPGLFITVEIVASETEVPVAVSSDAVQNVNNEPTIFVRVPGGFIAQPVITGLSDGKFVEIVKGLKPGTEYALNGSFVLKSEQGKEGASHEH